MFNKAQSQPGTGVDFADPHSVYGFLSRFVTLTGVTDHFECSACIDILKKRWGESGCRALEVVCSGLSKLLSPPNVERSQDSGDTYSVYSRFLDVTQDHITVSFGESQYDETQQQSIVDAMNWICLAIRPGIEGSEVLLKSRSDQAIISETARLRLRQTSLRPLETLTGEDIGASSCWTHLFRSGVVAWYEFDARSDWAVGLELSYSMMLHLAAIEISLPLSPPSRLLLLGFFSVLVPMKWKAEENSIQWHLDVSDEGEDIIDIRKVEAAEALGDQCQPTFTLGDFSEPKCFVGWCEKASILLGTHELDNHLDTLICSGLKRRERSIHLAGFSTGATVGVGGGPMAPVNISGQGTANWNFVNNTQRFEPATTYPRAINHSLSKVAFLFDNATKQAWLVPKLSLILHLCHKYFRSFSPPSRSGPDPIPFAEPDPDGAAAAHNALESRGNVVVFGKAGGDDAETLRQVFLQIYSYLLLADKTREKPNRTATFRKRIFLSELVDMVDSPDRGSPLREVCPPKQMTEWECLSELADVSLACSWIGPVVRPVSSPRQVCQVCTCPPRDKYYIIAHVWCLDKFSQRQGSGTELLRLGTCQLGEKLYWHVKASKWRQCASGNHSLLWDDSILQKISEGRTAGSNAALVPEPRIPLTGAIVFGRV